MSITRVSDAPACNAMRSIAGRLSEGHLTQNRSAGNRNARHVYIPSFDGKVRSAAERTSCPKRNDVKYLFTVVIDRQGRRKNSIWDTNVSCGLHGAFSAKPELLVSEHYNLIPTQLAVFNP